MTHDPAVYEARRPGSPTVVTGYGRCDTCGWTAVGPVEDVRRGAAEHANSAREAVAALDRALEEAASLYDAVVEVTGSEVLDRLAEAGWRLSRG